MTFHSHNIVDRVSRLGTESAGQWSVQESPTQSIDKIFDLHDSLSSDSQVSHAS